MHAVDVTVVALGENDAEEGLVELNEHLHVALFAFDVQRDDLGHVGRWSGPKVVSRQRSMWNDGSRTSSGMAVWRKWGRRAVVGSRDCTRMG